MILPGRASQAHSAVFHAPQCSTADTEECGGEAAMAILSHHKAHPSEQYPGLPLLSKEHPKPSLLYPVHMHRVSQRVAHRSYDVKLFS